MRRARVVADQMVEDHRYEASMAAKRRKDKAKYEREQRERVVLRNQHMAEREREEKEFVARRNEIRRIERQEHLKRRDQERLKWEQSEIQRKMKWCQMRIPWAKTTAKFKKEMQGMDLEKPD